MNSEDYWRLWQIMSNYISNKEQTLAIEEYLNHLYECEACDIKELKSYAEEEDDEIFVKCIKRFIKENELEDIYEDL